MEQGKKLHFEYWQFILSLLSAACLVIVFLYATFAPKSDLEAKENRDALTIAELKVDIKEIKADIKEILRNQRK